MVSRIFFLFFLLLPVCSASIAQGIIPEAITIENGLSQGMIFDVCQTRDGFLWIATKDGLNRYDGHNFKIFNHDPFTPFSLSENTITALFEDSRGWLWVGTDSKGLDLHIPGSNRFYHFPLNFQFAAGVLTAQIIDLTETSDGSIWALQRGNGLIRIAPAAGWAQQLPPDADLSKSARLDRIETDHWLDDEAELISLWLQPDGNLALFSTAAQYEVNTTTRAVKRLHNPDYPAYISSALQHPAQHGPERWLIDDHDGLYFSAHNRIQRLQAPAPWISQQSAIQEDGCGGVWLLFGEKIWRLDADRLPDFSKPDWVLDRPAKCITADRNGNIWVGTYGYGLRKINPRKQYFHTGLAGKSIWGLWRSPRGRYFWKDLTDIYVYDPLTRKSAAQKAFPELGERRNMDMIFEPSGAFWLLGASESQKEGWLFRYDPDGKLVAEYSFPLNMSEYSRLMKSRDGRLWITGASCQLARFDPQTLRFNFFNYAALFKENKPVAIGFAIAEDGNGVVWIGTQQGLVKGVQKGSAVSFELIQTDPGNPRGLNNNSIACLLPDPVKPGKVLWVGTKGGGINRIDLGTGMIDHITTRQGLPDNVVYGILPGPGTSGGELWCSTNRGLVKLKSNEKDQLSVVSAFTAAQGLQDNEFNTQAFFKANNGELLFGGVNGLNRFFPDAVRPDTTAPPVFIVGLRINHESITFGNPDSPLGKPLEVLQTLQLQHDQNNLSFEFAVLDFTDPAKNKYRYRLKGVDQDWVETGTHRFAYFTHLAPGSYTLLVQGSNGDGAWQNAANPISITILPPWWRSGAAWLVYALLLLAAGWQVYRFQIRRVQLREQLAFEHRETGRVKALEQMKTNFFSNVTHEFRTPLTLILEPARRILAHTQEPETRENARHINANSQRLLQMVNQLLDLAKLENGSMGVDLRHGNFPETLREIFRAFLPLANQRDIRLKLRISDDTPSFQYDENKTETILNNLISNALKFSPAGGTVTVACRKTEAPGTRQGPPGIAVSVSDTGPGIPAGLLDKIFERFYQTDPEGTGHARAGAGTGIGLALSKDLAELMGGSLTVSSTVGEGSEFTFWIPIAEASSMFEVQSSEPASPMPAADAAPSPSAPEASAQQPALPDMLPDEMKPCVLLIEDNAELRAFIKQCLSGQWSVAEASNGEEGIQKAMDLVPDLVISDVMMPRKDGYAVCEALKNGEITAHIPVILLTAKSAMDAKLKGLRTGADDYLTKPFNTDELLIRMQNLVEQRQRLRQHYGRQPLAETGRDPMDDAAFLTPPDREFLRRFTRTVEQHLPDETISVDDFAQKMAISRVQLHRKLKALTDRNVSDFVRDYRLDRAMAMLKNGEGMVYEVASRVGFGSEKYFSRAFKEKFGVPPGQIR